MLPHEPALPEYAQSCFARQPIFDESRKLWGYELFYRHNQAAQAAVIGDGHQATLEVAVNSCVGPQALVDASLRLLVHCEGRTIRERIPEALPAERTVLEVRESFLADPVVLGELARLRSERYLVAVEDYAGVVPAETLAGLADVLIVDVLGRARADLEAVLLPLKGLGPMLLAKRVEEYPAFDQARACGFDLYQGFFFQKPETLANRVLSASQAARLGIVRLIEQPEPDFPKLAETIQRDVSISYRLLSFLNSPFFGFGQKVTSIKHAMLLAGWRQLRNWLRLIILTDLAPKHKPSELAFLSAQRARFLELAALGCPRQGLAPDSLFLLGLFSLLDAMLDLPMGAIVDNLPLDQELKDTLCRKPTALVAWLEMVDWFERADWTRLDARLKGLGLDPVAAAGAYAESMEWANSFFHYL
jgi:EAL and modified HD-GYP domain-containing signal transduction protein